MQKLNSFVSEHTLQVKNSDNRAAMRACYDRTAQFYRKAAGKKK